jgi:predicted phage terminase large subunit-like protein
MQNEVLIASRKSLLSYAVCNWRQFQIGNHTRLIADKLQKVEQGIIKRLIIEAPPRHGKTYLVSENFPAWYMGKHPDHSIIFSSYSQKIANKSGRKVRNQILNQGFAEIFPECALSIDSKSKSDFVTTLGGEYKAVGVGGGVTGSGGHLVILDDTLKGRKQADSKVFRDDLKEFYSSSIYTRLYPGAAIIIMQTRWHEDDLIGHVLAEHADENWVRLTLPAINDNNEALWPERYPLERLLKIKAVMSAYDWLSLYQQRPSSKEGNIFKKDRFVFHDQPPEDYDTEIQSWDLSFKEGIDNSFVVGQVWRKRGPMAYLCHQFRKQIGFNDTVRAFLMTQELFPFSFGKLVEEKANGPAVIESLKNKVPGIIPVPATSSKESRAAAVSDIQESGCVSLPNPDKNPWVLEFIERCGSFPKCDFDDEIDAMTQALDHLYGSSISNLERMVAG